MVFAGLASVAGALADGWSVTLLKSDSDWQQVYANDINDNGRIAGFWQSTSTPSQAIYWAKASAEAVELDGIDGFTGSWASCVNNRSEIGGSVGSFPVHAVIWAKDGTPTDMHPTTPFSLYSQIWNMNDHGDACGVLGVRGFFRAYRWWADGSSELLEKSSGSVVATRSYGMNKAGAVAGIEFPAPGTTFHAVYWDADGNITQLHDELVAANSDIVYSLAWKISDKDEVMGIAFDSDSSGGTQNWAWIWTADDGVTFLDIDGTDLGVVWQGRGKHFAGIINGNGSNTEDAEAAVWTRGTSKGETIYTLDVIPTPKGFVNSRAHSINTSGTAIGVAEDDDGNVRSWIASPHATGKKNN